MEQEEKSDPLVRVRKKRPWEDIDPAEVKAWSLDVLKFMTQSPDSEYTIAEISNLFNITRQQASKRFRKLHKWGMVRRRGPQLDIRFTITAWGMKFVRDKESGKF